MQILYFDFDHGTERKLSVMMNRQDHSLHFRYERSPDPTYDEDNAGVDHVSVDAALTCPDLPQFDGFVRALVAAMRETPFSLQDPKRPLFEAMPHDALHLEGISDGVPPSQLKMRLPAEIVVELLSPHYYSPRFKPLICIPKEWKPDRFWYEYEEKDQKKTLMVKFDEEALTIEFDFHQEAGKGKSIGEIKERRINTVLHCPDRKQLHGVLHALAKAMSVAGRYSSAYVLGAFMGKQGGRRYLPAKIAINQVAEICLKFVPVELTPNQLEVRIPREIVPELVPLQSLEDGMIPNAWLHLI